MKDPHEMRTGNRYAREAEERRTLGDLIAIANPAFAMGLLVALDQSHEAVERRTSARRADPRCGMSPSIRWRPNALQLSRLVYSLAPSGKT